MGLVGRPMSVHAVLMRGSARAAMSILGKSKGEGNRVGNAASSDNGNGHRPNIDDAVPPIHTNNEPAPFSDFAGQGKEVAGRRGAFILSGPNLPAPPAPAATP